MDIQQLGGQCGAIGATCARYPSGKAQADGAELTCARLTKRADLAHNGAMKRKLRTRAVNLLRHYHYFELAIIAGARPASLPKS